MRYIKLLSIVAALFGLSVVSSAQTAQDVFEALQKGLALRNEIVNAETSRTEYSDDLLNGAIAEFERCIELAIAVGTEEAEMHSIQAEGFLPPLYLRVALRIPPTDLLARLQAFEVVIEVSEKYFDDETGRISFGATIH